MKSYSKWESYKCKSSCIAEFDKVFREYAKSPVCSCFKSDYYGNCACENNFKDKLNPMDSCGKSNYVDPGNDGSNGNTTSDATSLHGQIALICLLIALFK